MAIRGEGVRASDFATVIPVIILVCCVVALAIWSAIKPRRLIAWVLLVVSLLPACFLGSIAYNQVRGFGVGYLVSLSWTVGFWFCEIAILVILPFLWVAVCLRWRSVVVDAA